MTGQPLPLIPFSEKTTLTYNLPKHAPDIPATTGTLVPTRITIRYTQSATGPIHQGIEVTVRGLWRNPGGGISNSMGTLEQWRYIAAEDRPAWIVQLVADNTPAWWNA